MKKQSVISDIKRRLQETGLRPNKVLGQNFLINSGVYRKILTALQIAPGDTIVEVGPGLGNLTHHLARAGAKVIAVEKDRVLAEYLKKEFPVNSRVEIVNQDILKFDPGTYNLKPKTYNVVGNIPYYLTSRLLRLILNDWPPPELMVFMVQKEVAQRICAKPPEMSLLAVSVQYYTEPQIVSYVSRGSFYPMPKVDSALLKLEVGNRIPEINTEKFFQIVRAGFAGKRKQLQNNLSSSFKISKQEAEKILRTVNIDPRRRAETLTLEEWQKITDNLDIQY